MPAKISVQKKAHSFGQLAFIASIGGVHLSRPNRRATDCQMKPSASVLLKSQVHTSRHFLHNARSFGSSVLERSKNQPELGRAENTTETSKSEPKTNERN